MRVRVRTSLPILRAEVTTTGMNKHERPAEVSTKLNDQYQSGDESEELLQELADDGAERGLHLVDIVDQRGEDGARGVLVKEA